MPGPSDSDSLRKDRVQETRVVRVPMRDGVRLSVDLYRPVGTEPVPAILSITPYDNDGLRASARWFADNGYAFIAADQRGRYDSEGEYDPFDGRHHDDGYDLVEWIAAQPWCTGKVGMAGQSAGGWTQWWTASAAPPHLSVIMPIVAPGDAFEGIPYQHGVLPAGWFVDWTAGLAGRTIQNRGTAGYWGWSGDRDVEHRHTPYAELNTARGVVGGDHLRGWWSRPTSDDPFWEAIAYQGEERFGRITVPSLSITGWYDAVYTGTPLNYVGMRDHGGSPEARKPRMIVGPWSHGINQRVVAGVDFGEDAVFDLDGLILRWFDHHLKGVDGGFDDEPPVRLFVMGSNVWKSFEDWPPPAAVPTPYYFTEGGGLSTVLPETAGSSSYAYDPRDPTPDAYGSLPEPPGAMDGPRDTSASAARDDVLTFRTEVLASPVEVIGPIEAVLHAATSARDTDWFVRLVDIHPDGSSILIAEGAMRARCADPENDGRFRSDRLSEVRPGEVTKYTVRFWRDTANLFDVGHRIGIEISSSWFPFFLPNLGTGADNAAMVSIEEAVVATQEIHHGPAAPSHVLLPVIPASS